jgi:hypothetical protein
MIEHSTNVLLDAINSAVVSAIRHSVEIATEPLLKRVATLEQQQNELYDVIKTGLKGYVNNAIEHAFKSPEHSIWVSVLKSNLLDSIDNKIEATIKRIPAGNITGLSEAIDESLQNQATISADDICGLKNFVRDVINEVRSKSIDADDIDGLDKFVRDVIDDVSQDDDSVTDKVKEALRQAADSI